MELKLQCFATEEQLLAFQAGVEFTNDRALECLGTYVGPNKCHYALYRDEDSRADAPDLVATLEHVVASLGLAPLEVLAAWMADQAGLMDGEDFAHCATRLLGAQKNAAAAAEEEGDSA